jgi:DNA-binding response OmpR family regulator
LATPPGDDGSSASGSASGLSLLDLFRRMPCTPPIVVLRSPAFTKRQAERLLVESMRLGAFSVLDKPIDLERLLAVFRRMMDRHYRGSGPEAGKAGFPGTTGSSKN